MTSPRTPNVLNLQGRNYVVEKSLGEGAFGKVYKVREADGSGCVYAMKKIQVENVEAIDMVKKEIGILSRCSHDHIVSLCGFSATRITGSTFVLILMEYCEGGNLNSRLARSSDHDTDLRWMKELADAISYLHSNKIAHRDLKPENVLLTANDSIKLGDFGLAREYAVLRQAFATRSDQALVSYLNGIYMGTALGTPDWMAPEVFEGHYTESADVFALGIIFYAILTRTYELAGGKRYYGAFVNINGQKIGLGMAMRRNPSVMVKMDGLSRPTKDLVLSMLDYYPKNRSKAPKVLEKVKSLAHSNQFSPHKVQSPERVHSPVYTQPYRRLPFPQHNRPPPPPPSGFSSTPTPNFIAPSPSPNRQSPRYSPNNIPRRPQLPFPQHNRPPPPGFLSSTHNVHTPQALHRISPTNARQAQRSPILNSPSANAGVRLLQAHGHARANVRPACIRGPAHVRIHTPGRIRRS